MCNDAHTSWDKKCEDRKREYLRIEVAKQSIPQLYDISSKLFYKKEESLGEMRSLSKSQQKPPPKDRTSQQHLSQEMPMQRKRRKSASDGSSLLQTPSENESWFTAAAKVQIFEQPTTRSQNQNITDKKSL